jgi:hypothetical protein
VRGHLTAAGADLLCRAVLDLHHRGRRRIVLDLQDVHGADDVGLLMLQHLQLAVAVEGGSLLVRPPCA